MFFLQTLQGEKVQTVDGERNHARRPQKSRRLAVLREEKRLSANIGADNIGCFNSDSHNNGERNYAFSNVGSGKCSTAVLPAQEADATADQNLCNVCAHNISSDGVYCEYDCVGVIKIEGDSVVVLCEDYEKKGEVCRDKT